MFASTIYHVQALLRGYSQDQSDYKLFLLSDGSDEMDSRTEWFPLRVSLVRQLLLASGSPFLAQIPISAATRHSGNNAEAG